MDGCLCIVPPGMGDERQEMSNTDIHFIENDMDGCDLNQYPLLFARC